MRVLLPILFLCSCAARPGPAPNGGDDPALDPEAPTTLEVDPEVERAAINTVIDDWHKAAAEADQERYLGHFTKDAVFLGTDATERWPVYSDDEGAPGFSAYVELHFPRGGWDYQPHDREVQLAADGYLAWFDEQLTNERAGELRGTGLLRREEGQWRIAHYSMTFTVPNGVSSGVILAIKEWQAANPPR